MKSYKKEFDLYAQKHLNISSIKLHDFHSSLTPYIIEERQLNVAQMDVFSRLMMDRIIFLGTAINDYVSNVVQAQLLFLESLDSKKPINMYLNSPGGSVVAGLGIYDTMQFVGPEVITICTGMAASMGAVFQCEAVGHDGRSGTGVFRSFRALRAMGQGPDRTGCDPDGGVSDRRHDASRSQGRPRADRQRAHDAGASGPTRRLDLCQPGHRSVGGVSRPAGST
jgi:hypothetical protein